MIDSFDDDHPMYHSYAKLEDFDEPDAPGEEKRQREVDDAAELNASADRMCEALDRINEAWLAIHRLLSKP